jgi:hypothetical protein
MEIALVEAPMSQDWTTARKLWEERSPMGQGAQPAEIAQVVSMLVASHYFCVSLKDWRNLSISAELTSA